MAHVLWNNVDSVLCYEANTAQKVWCLRFRRRKSRAEGSACMYIADLWLFCRGRDARAGIGESVELLDVALDSLCRVGTGSRSGGGVGGDDGGGGASGAFERVIGGDAVSVIALSNLGPREQRRTFEEGARKKV